MSITYGDMPLWSAQTIRTLLHADIKCAGAHESSVVTMVTVRRSRTSTILERYGRVIRNHAGAIDRIVEVNDWAAGAYERSSQWVNPSLWVWDLAWLDQHIGMLVPTKRESGAPERYIPPLVALARRSGGIIEEYQLPADRAHQALDVNTLDELTCVRGYACA